MKAFKKLGMSIINIRNKESVSGWWRVPRSFLFLFGCASLLWFWFSIFGIVIGIAYFLLLKDIAWRRNGLILSLTSTITTFLIEIIDVIYIAFGIVVMLLSFVIIVIYDIIRIIRRRKRIRNEFLLKLLSGVNPKVKIFLVIIIIFIPLILWSVVSIDFGVMFDNKTRLIWINVPSTVDIGQEFDITIEAWDSFERISATFKGNVDFSVKSYNLTDYTIIHNPNVLLPEIYTFTGSFISSDRAYMIKNGKDNGIHTFKATINTQGYHYILVNDTFTGNTYWSNPIMVNNLSSTDPLLLWGDLHSHSELSDGSGTPKHAFYFAKNVALLDYYCLSDHGEHLDLFGLLKNPPNLFPVLEDACNKVNNPGVFVTFQGVEWTTGYITTRSINHGHYVCIFSGNTLPIISANSYKTANSLWDALDDFTLTTGYRTIVIPHHTVRQSFLQDWTYYNPKYVKFAEVSSVHGDSLFEPWQNLSYRGSVDIPPGNIRGSCIIDALSMGYKMSICAGGDSHDGHPGHSLSHTRAYIGHQFPMSIWHPRNDHPYPNGLTAVYAENFTREGIFTGLENQKVYANSDHGRPILNFTINGTMIGEGSTFIASNQNAHREITVFLAQDGSPVALKNIAASVTSNWKPKWNTTIEIIKNGNLLYNEIVSEPVIEISYLDNEPITGVSFQDHCIYRDGQYFINKYSDNPINPSTLNTNGFDYYIIRIVSHNGRTSYIGPIYVEF